LVILIKLRIELNNLEPKLSFGPTLQKIQRKHYVRDEELDIRRIYKMRV